MGKLLDKLSSRVTSREEAILEIARYFSRSDVIKLSALSDWYNRVESPWAHVHPEDLADHVGEDALDWAAPEQVADEKAALESIGKAYSQLKRDMDDLQALADKWYVPFNPRLALTQCCMFDSAHGQWQSSACW